MHVWERTRYHARHMDRDTTIDVGEALDSLVHQFSDPWSFLRELIQNAIDADSPEIEVCIEHEPPDMMVVEVRDAGSGMDRQIIDTRLTRLFASSKEGDYTKIGRFGIGFVSVFAIDPEVVCLDTGRNGEYWRVLFRKDRSFERIVLDTPIEGTSIRLYKRATENELRAARVRAREVLGHWCKHACVEIRCDGVSISRPMSLDADCVITHEEEGTTVLLGFVDQREALRGYYHGGLTLHEEHDDRLPYVAFKIDSRYLEHTLTRDNVLRDDNYAKAMGIVGRLARTRLIEQLVDTLAQRTGDAVRGVRDDAEGVRDESELERLRSRLYEVISAPGAELPAKVFEQPLVPALTAAGPELLSLARVRKLGKRCWSGSPSPVTDALVERGETVLLFAPDSFLAMTIGHLCEGRPPRVSSLCTARAATQTEHARWQPLREATLAQLSELGLELSGLELGHLAYAESPVADHVAIAQAKLGELTPIEEVGKLASGWFGRKRVLVVNADHPTVAHLLELGASEPELAGYLLLKLFFLRTELDPLRDNSLASFAAEARWLRTH
jgi:hypothetical protein